MYNSCDQPANSNRRKLMKVLTGVITAPFATPVITMPFIVTPSKAASKKIVVRDSGGLFSRVYADVFYKPFTQETGIEVVSVASEQEPTAQIQGMVKTKRYLWDIASLSQTAILMLTTGNECYLEKHELDDDPIISSILPQFRSSYGVGTHVYTTVLAYRTDAFKGRRAPESWEDLWDINHFPGRRGLRKHPFDTTEVALMADSVPLSGVYPCDLDRAFRRLDKIKSHIAVWWGGGPQVEQLLKSGELDVLQALADRAQAAIDAGAPVSFSWNQHIYGCDTWAILKGSPHADACRQFIKFVSAPKRQALLAPYLIGPTQPDAFNHIEAKYAKRLPVYPDNLKKGLFIDAAYWAKHQQVALERFNDWLLK